MEKKNIYMKKAKSTTTILLLSFMSISFSAVSQASKINYLVNTLERKQVVNYQEDTKLNSIKVESAFSSDTMDIIDLEGYRITKIDYVYSQFRESASFKQKDLDLVRFIRLFKACPALLKNDIIQWNIYTQTGCNSSEECRKYIHGFVIYYESTPSAASTQKELEWLMSSLETLEDKISSSESNRVITHKEFPCRFPQLKGESYVIEKLGANLEKTKKNKGTYQVHYNINEKGNVLDVEVQNYNFDDKEDLHKYLKRYIHFAPASIGLRKMSGMLSGTITFPLKKGSLECYQFEFERTASKKYTFRSDSYKDCSACRSDTTYPDLTEKTDYHSFSSVLNRNSSWEANLFVVDVTGSMYPYTADMLIWLRLNTIGNEKQFVFFNDGDLKNDSKKKIGSTGGIYGVKTDEFLEVKKTVVSAMSGGYGGDLPENNFEALLSGKKMCPECNDVVMLADNYAFPRDVELLKKYSGNLKIILCGTNYGINPAYLDLAREYGFSVHTMSSDLKRLYDLHEGAILEIDGFTYKIVKNKFERVYGS
jgi:hypothetical protein